MSGSTHSPKEPQGLQAEPRQFGSKIGQFCCQMMSGGLLSFLALYLWGRPHRLSSSTRNSEHSGILRRNSLPTQSNYSVPRTTSASSSARRRHHTKQEERQRQSQRSEHSSVINSGTNQEYITQKQQEEFASDSPVTNPPVTGRYLHTFSYLGKYGENTALGLTDDLVWQLNKVFTSKHMLKTCQRDMKELVRQKSEIEALDLSPQQEGCISTREYCRSLSINSPNEIARMLERTTNDIALLEEECQQIEKELETTECLMFQELEEVFGRSNLLTWTGMGTQDGYQEDNNVGAKIYVPCPPLDQREELHNETLSRKSSTAATQRLADERNAIQELVYERRLELQNAQEILENWESYQHQEYARFCAWQEENPDTTRTEFDVTILQEAQVATRNLIDAENKLKDAIVLGQELGVLFDDDQESQFLDHPDDGYRLSWEAEMASYVDRSRIERWMAEEGSIEEKFDFPPQCDDWAFNDVDISDSISMVAEGKDRERIDRWRSMCDMTRNENYE